MSAVFELQVHEQNTTQHKSKLKSKTKPPRPETLLQETHRHGNTNRNTAYEKHQAGSG